jgi:hypothetical protein
MLDETDERSDANDDELVTTPVEWLVSHTQKEVAILTSRSSLSSVVIHEEFRLRLHTDAYGHTYLGNTLYDSYGYSQFTPNHIKFVLDENLEVIGKLTQDHTVLPLEAPDCIKLDHVGIGYKK